VQPVWVVTSSEHQGAGHIGADPRTATSSGATTAVSRESQALVRASCSSRCSTRRARSRSASRVVAARVSSLSRTRKAVPVRQQVPGGAGHGVASGGPRGGDEQLADLIQGQGLNACLGCAAGHHLQRPQTRPRPSWVFGFAVPSLDSTALAPASPGAKGLSPGIGRAAARRPTSLALPCGDHRGGPCSVGGCGGWGVEPQEQLEGSGRRGQPIGRRPGRAGVGQDQVQ